LQDLSKRSKDFRQPVIDHCGWFETSSTGQSARRKGTTAPVDRTVFASFGNSDGALRIRDVADALSVPHQSINALMQYLKRKHLVKKSGQEFNAPYSLTDEGRATLAEMTRRHAA
jgi:DNA-binding MarR family transcriptional regulator